MENKMREEFEAWAIKPRPVAGASYLESYDIGWDDYANRYYSPLTRCAFEGYQAGRNHPIEESPWKDTPDQWSEAIAAAHPTKTKDFATQDIAREMVGNRHSKGALIDLVNWLLVEKQKPIEVSLEEAARALCKTDGKDYDAIKSWIGTVDDYTHIDESLETVNQYKMKAKAVLSLVPNCVIKE